MSSLTKLLKLTHGWFVVGGFPRALSFDSQSNSSVGVDVVGVVVKSKPKKQTQPRHEQARNNEPSKFASSSKLEIIARQRVEARGGR